MARTTVMEAREDAVVRRLAEIRVLPVVTLRSAGQAVPVARALMAGGIGCIEIALRSDAGLEAIRRASEVDDLLVAAGTVLTVEQLRAAAEAGADFAVAPGFNEAVVAEAQQLGLPFFAGVATPTEIDRARRAGLRTLKVFPVAQVGGPGFLRAMSAVYPDVRFIPTGGIRRDSVADYLALPCVVACGGTWIAAEELLAEDDLDAVSRLAGEAIALAS
jgi:2-dehydro-3-deoxyphosphogluconate aldolase/(4S)-4-hydroxy-2-oxoglutarate aldolase